MSTNTFVKDYLSRDQMYWWYWVWICPVLCLIHIVLRDLEHKGKITFVSKWLGPSISTNAMIKGPVFEKDDQQTEQNYQMEHLVRNALLKVGTK